MVVRLEIPKPAVVRRKFVSQNNFAVTEVTKFQFEVHQPHSRLGKEVGQQGVDFPADTPHLFEFLVGRNPERNRRRLVDEWIVQLVALVESFFHRFG